jgi:hypothetical protein
MNDTLIQSSYTGSICPPGFGLGYRNESGLLYLVCSESIPKSEPVNESNEYPLSPSLVYVGLAIIGCLCLTLLYSALPKRKPTNRAYSQV